MVSGRLRLWLIFAALALITVGLLLGAGWSVASGALPLWLALPGALLTVVVVQALAWVLLDWSLVRPAMTLAREIPLMIHANRARALQPPTGHGLGPLPAAIASLAEHWRRQREEQDEALARATGRLAEQQSRLEAILRELSDGIVACSADRRILLFNDAAVRLFAGDHQLGLDRPLDALIAREPIAHTFELLRDRLGEEGATRAAGARDEFVCATADGAKLLRCRMVPILGPEQQATGFVLDFADATERLGRDGGAGARLARLVQELRRPVAAVRAAAEVLGGGERLPAAEQTDFAEMLEREGATLGERLDALATAASGIATGDWPMADLFSADLVRWVERRLATRGDAGRLTPVGGGLWLHGDGYHLTRLLERLVHRIGETTGATDLDLEAQAAGRRVRLDLVWRGDPLASATLDRWLEEGLDDGHGTLRDVLERHDGELWSQRHGRPAHALLRLPLPGPRRPQIGPTPAAERLPPRPEFYDFDLLARRSDSAVALTERPLAELGYVVFDTETTGLDPARDRVIQIAGVRIVNRRLLSGETFDRLVNPGRPIPKASIRFHGITDDMVQGRPPIEIALPQFHAFARGAVLVAHNAAFDMAFLRQAEERAGVRFDHPVLDTLLLSAMLHDHTPEHSLDAIAERFGITLVDRHRALGDAIGTAQLLLRLIDLLAAEGVHTLGDALRLSERAVAIRRRQSEQFGRAPGATVAALGGR